MTAIPESFESFELLLAEAMDGVRALRTQDPGDRWIASIEKQLEFVLKATRSAQRPGDEDLARLNFGLLASKAVDDIDRSLAEKLYALAYYLDHWPPVQTGQG